MGLMKDKMPLDIDREKSILHDFHRNYQNKKVGVIYGPKSREDKYYIEKSSPEQLAITALTNSLNRLYFSSILIDPTKEGFIEAILESELVFMDHLQIS